MREAQPKGLSCPCAQRHTPKPMEYHRHHIIPAAFGGSNSKSNLIWVCPTTHQNIHRLLRHYVQYGGIDPHNARSYPRFARELARQGYDGTIRRGLLDQARRYYDGGGA